MGDDDESREEGGRGEGGGDWLLLGETKTRKGAGPGPAMG